MERDQEHKERFRRWDCCVLIPTYNNAASLEKVLQGVLDYCEDPIVVDDGSTDGTQEVLEAFSQVRTIHFPENRGKGKALRKGFEHAREVGFERAITIDADGQHDPTDLPRFLDELEEDPDALIVGARNMEQEGVPGGSSFGNRFSNFWFRVETGIRLPDTQSGFRLYPLRPLERLRFFTSKYEFEVEVLVKAAWSGIPVKSVPVTVHYAPKEERVSHFRPFWDFARISLLNSYLVLLALLYERHRMLFRKWRKKKPRDLIRGMLKPEASLRRASVSVGFGVLMGILPIWGYQLASAIFLAHLFRLNKVLVALSAQISIPPMIPFILYGSYLLGGLVLPGEGVSVRPISELTLENVGEGLYQYLVGSVLLAGICSTGSGLLTYGILSFLRFRREERGKREKFSDR